MEYSYRDELYHHGILGQKWGKKNGPPYPLSLSDHSAAEKKAGWRKSLDKKAINIDLRADRERTIAEYEKNLPKDKKFSLTTEEKKRLATVAIGTAAVIGVGAAIYFSYKSQCVSKMTELAKEDLLTKDVAKKVMSQTLEDGDQIFKQGDVLHRMSAYSGVDYTQSSKPLYVSYKKEDVASYMTLLKDWAKTGKRFDVTLEAVKDIRIPSEQKARKMFDELWSSDPAYRQQLEKTVTDAYVKLGVSPLYAKMQVQMDLKADPFKVAMYSIVKNKEDTAKWVEKLQKSGYDAIIDYFDKGVMANSPLIILDPKSSIQKTGETFVTKQMKLDTLQALKDSGVKVMPGQGGYSVDTVMRMITFGKL